MNSRSITVFLLPVISLLKIAQELGRPSRAGEGSRSLLLIPGCQDSNLIFQVPAM